MPSWRSDLANCIQAQIVHVVEITNNENNAFTLSRINGPVIWLLLMVVLCYNKMPSKQYEAHIFYDTSLKKKRKVSSRE